VTAIDPRPLRHQVCHYLHHPLGLKWVADVLIDLELEHEELGLRKLVLEFASVQILEKLKSVN
jgi:hypothetical protein